MYEELYFVNRNCSATSLKHVNLTSITLEIRISTNVIECFIQGHYIHVLGEFTNELARHECDTNQRRTLQTCSPIVLFPVPSLQRGGLMACEKEAAVHGEVVGKVVIALLRLTCPK